MDTAAYLSENMHKSDMSSFIVAAQKDNMTFMFHQVL